MIICCILIANLQPSIRGDLSCIAVSCYLVQTEADRATISFLIEILSKNLLPKETSVILQAFSTYFCANKHLHYVICIRRIC